MIDSILLAPYYWSLKTRHFLYDNGYKKRHDSEIPTIALGNITVGGTGKTPHVEMILRTLYEDESFRNRHIAVLSRGYGRKSKGFQQVKAEGTAKEYGDEPLQIKKKFPGTTVAVDKSRIEGISFLTHPERLAESPQGQKCLDRHFPAADLVILDDAFQYRALRPSLSIVLIDYRRPIFEDHLMPIGRLRDLPERISDADVIIVTKCDPSIDEWEKGKWAESLGIESFDGSLCKGTNSDGKTQHLFFTRISYCEPEAVFPEGDSRFLYSKSLILFTAIANSKPLFTHLCDRYKILQNIDFTDHHKFSKSDINQIASYSRLSPTSVVMTTEKDCQRIKDCTDIPVSLKQKMFYTPIEVRFVTEQEKEEFRNVLRGIIA